LRTDKIFVCTEATLRTKTYNNQSYTP